LISSTEGELLVAVLESCIFISFACIRMTMSNQFKRCLLTDPLSKCF
jgi:hypothetical protein